MTVVALTAFVTVKQKDGTVEHRISKWKTWKNRRL
jgi:hypothetical protein